MKSDRSFSVPRATIRFFISVLALALPLSALALVEREDATRDARWIDHFEASARSETLDVNAAIPAARSAREFLARRGGEWRFAVDPRTGFATMVQGSGVPLVPGAQDVLDAFIVRIELDDPLLSAETGAGRTTASRVRSREVGPVGNQRSAMAGVCGLRRDP